MQLKIQSISPIHIGTGNFFEPFEFIIKDKVFYKLDKDKAFRIILNKRPEAIDKISKWLNDNSNNITKSRSNEEQSELRNKFNLYYFCKEILGDISLTTEIINNASSYLCEIPYDLQGKYQIAEHIKDPASNLYIPGSTIKGAIRTALLNMAIMSLSVEKITEITQSITESNSYISKKGKEIDDLLIDEIFNCGKSRFNKNANTSFTDYTDIKYDLLKFITVSDAHPIKCELQILPPNLYIANQEPQTQLNALECIRFNSTFLFNINVNEDELRTIQHRANNEKWIDFDLKFERLFGVKITDVAVGKLEEVIVKSILEKIDTFTKLIIEKELVWIKSVENFNPSQVEYINEFYELYKSDIPNMLRIGWGSGFISTTAFLSFIKNSIGKEFIVNLLNHFRIGIPQNLKSDNTAEIKSVKHFPKSRRLVSQSIKIPQDPLGWIAIMDVEDEIELE
ncbi:MAG TPA: type III-A CRISPR-associated RAMP protein Csm5 [Melioribacteraceae bacterium]|nr:type III-A CRISPR-associated RAMP protein Csm5 [Melioribacteraceae bacterium]